MCFLGGLSNSRSHWHTKYGTSYNFNPSRHILKNGNWRALYVRASINFPNLLWSESYLKEAMLNVLQALLQHPKHWKCHSHLSFRLVHCAIHITEKTHLRICLPKPEPLRWSWFHPATKWNHVGAAVLPHLATFIYITAASNQANTGTHQGHTQMET